ncbi:urease accessory protein UreF [Sporosarcina sp. CAU 1771]
MKRQKSDSNNHLNTVDMHINTGFLHLMQIHDSAFPIGTYTQSYGMETFIQEDLIHSKESLIEYCQSFLVHNLAYGDAILIQEAYKAAKEGNLEKLLSLDELCGAIKLAKESRDASINVGKQFLRTVSPLNEFPLITDWQLMIKNGEAKGHYAVVFGIYCALNEVDCNQAVTMYLYSTINGLIQNAVRAVPFGQNTGVQVLHELLGSIVDTAKIVYSLTEKDIANNALSVELASMKHEYLYSRLFIS